MLNYLPFHSGDASFRTALHKEGNLLVDKCSIGTVAFSPEGTYVATGDDQGHIAVSSKLGMTVWALILIDFCCLDTLDGELGDNPEIQLRLQNQGYRLASDPTPHPICGDWSRQFVHHFRQVSKGRFLLQFENIGPSDVKSPGRDLTKGILWLYPSHQRKHRWFPTGSGIYQRGGSRCRPSG